MIAVALLNGRSPARLGAHAPEGPRRRGGIAHEFGSRSNSLVIQARLAHRVQTSNAHSKALSFEEARMRGLVSRAWRKVGNSQGTSLVEAAIITPLLLLLTFAIVDFGALFYVYMALENGVSVATRFAITGNTLTAPGGAALSRTESIKLAMRRATPTLTIGDGDFGF